MILDHASTSKSRYSADHPAHRPWAYSGSAHGTAFCTNRLSSSQSCFACALNRLDAASDRNEYQEYLLGGKGGRWAGPTTLPLSCADCLEILEASTSWSPQGPSWRYDVAQSVEALRCKPEGRGFDSLWDY
jgi:hypothetical protein